jgi:hypothetical protein
MMSRKCIGTKQEIRTLSALAPLGLNAIHLATDLIADIGALQDRLAREGLRDADYEVPYTTGMPAGSRGRRA